LSNSSRLVIDPTLLLLLFRPYALLGAAVDIPLVPLVTYATADPTELYCSGTLFLVLLAAVVVLALVP